MVVLSPSGKFWDTTILLDLDSGAMADFERKDSGLKDTHGAH